MSKHIKELTKNLIFDKVEDYKINFGFKNGKIYSYDTKVGEYQFDKNNNQIKQVSVTSRKYSTTTSRHLNLIKLLFKQANIKVKEVD